MGNSRSVYHAGALAAFAILTVAAAPPQPPEPREHPDWSEISTQGRSILTGNLFDPSSAQIRWVSGFQWGFLKPLIGRRTFGWIACVTMNAKNRLGGYTGTSSYLVFVDQTGQLTVAPTVEWISTCDSGPAAPVQAELADIDPQRQPDSAAIPNVADEIQKLASLRDKGLLSAEEFQNRKERLLAQ